MSVRDDVRKVLDGWRELIDARVRVQMANYADSRRFQSRSTEGLKLLCVVTFRKWFARGVAGPLPPDHLDWIYELVIRGEPIPFGEIRRELDFIRDQMLTAADELATDPLASVTDLDELGKRHFSKTPH